MRLLCLLVLAGAALAEEDLFDGRTMAGWTVRGGPYDGDARWTVEDGALVGRRGPGGAGGLLYTEKEYRNFELELEARVPWPFDSGIFVRMRPGARGAQVTLDVRPGGEVGGIYADGWWLHNPAGLAAFRRDEWNRFRVRCVGDPMHVQAWMNGEPLVDYRFPDAAEGLAPAGRIGLQVHGGGDEHAAVRFRDVRVRVLPDDAGRYFEEGALTEEGRAAGWRPLDLEEPPSGFRVRDGVLELRVEGDAPFIATKSDHKDFHLRLEFKTARMANSGVFLRAARDGANPAFSGCEIQILDDFNWESATGTTLRPWQFTGSLYGAVPPGAEALRPLGEWNALEVLYLGARLNVALNGRVLYDVDTLALDVEPPFAARAKAGFIGIQRHAGAVEGEAYAWFRRLFVRELK